MTNLYLVRHGETDLNTQGVFYGWTDCALSSRGVNQAKALARLLRDVTFDVIVSSTLKRARETAEIIRGFDSRELVLDEGLKELNFGTWEGKNYKTIQEEDPKNWDLWVKDWIKVCPPLGETFAALYRRVERSIKEILSRYDEKTVMIVSHQGCLRIIMCVLLNMDDKGYWHFTFDHGAYSLVTIKQGHCTLNKINQKP